jgi:hypothetical protein
MNEKRFRLDFLIALGALLISSVAALASIYQSRIIAQQFSATVWPYVSLDTTNSPSLLELDVRNDGLGPAIIHSVDITYDGKPQASLEALFAFLARDTRFRTAIRAALRAGQKVSLTTSTPAAGTVIAANTQHTIIRIDGAVLVQHFRPGVERFGLSLCYCSLTGACWEQRLRNGGAEPRAVRNCSNKGAS